MFSSYNTQVKQETTERLHRPRKTKLTVSYSQNTANLVHNATMSKGGFVKVKKT